MLDHMQLMVSGKTTNDSNLFYLKQKTKFQGLTLVCQEEY
jgi:hypothetical protein